METLDAFFADHLYQAADDAVAPAEVARVASDATRFVLFKIGQIRFALASTAIAAYTRAPERDCQYVAGQHLVPERYRAVAAGGTDHEHYIHLAGTRFGIGPCKSDGEIVTPSGEVAPRNRQGGEPWIAATLTTPPSLVLEIQALNARLLEVSKERP